MFDGLARGLDESRQSGLPHASDICSCRHIVHDGCRIDVEAGIIGPLDVIDLGAVDGVICTVKDMVTAADKTDVLSPRVDPVCPVGIGLIAGVAGEPACKLEEGTIAHSALGGTRNRQLG